MRTSALELAMLRHRALQVLLIVFGSICVATGYLLVRSLLGQWPMSQGDQMILGIFFPIGVFVLLAVPDPAANRTLILAVAWSNLCHAGVMAIQGLQHPNQAPSDPLGLAILAIIAVGLIGLTPRRAKPSAPAPLEAPAPLARAAADAH